jgi:WD repeat-containing protein 48
MSPLCSSSFLYGLRQQHETFFRDRLIANDFIQVRKVAEHVYEKVLGAGSESGSVAGPSSPGTERTDPERQETGSIAEDRVELLCNDQVFFSSSELAYLE